ncbi:MAG: DUF177 domain-containing protein [Acidobacteriota bacterium]
MRIDIRELDLGPLNLRGSIRAEELSLDPSEVALPGKIEVEVVAERQASNIRVRGHFATEIEVACSRCLEAVHLPLISDFDQFYQSNAEHHLMGEIELSEKDTELGFFSGDCIDVSDIIREQILLALPMKPMCREDCLGLCPYCGKNRNLTACDCESLSVDPRLAELIRIRNRMNF